MKSIFNIAVFLFILIPLLQPSGGIVGAQTTYYISSSTGNDSNNGTSINTPWKTLNRASINSRYISWVAGDAILFKRGDVFVGCISLNLNGSAENPIIVGAYGVGAKPILFGNYVRSNWMKVPGYDSIYKCFVGRVPTMNGFDYYNGKWNEHSSNGGWIGSVFYGNYLTNRDSLTKYLNGFAPSSFGPGNVYSDTVWLRTFDGLPPSMAKTRILVGVSGISGSNFIVQDLDLREYYYPMYAQNVTNSIFRNLSVKNAMGPGIYLAINCRENLVELCDVDSTHWTAFYNYKGYHNTFRYNRATNIVNGVLGISASSELGAFGCQEDTCTVIEYNIGDNLESGGIDSYHTQGDTLRFNVFTQTANGIYLNGNGTYSRGNSITTRGSGGGISINATGTGTMTSTGDIVKGASYGITVSENSGGGSVKISNDQISVSSVGNKFLYMPKVIPGVTSINNIFTGASAGFQIGASVYGSVTAFRTAMGYEEGSTFWGLPTGSFTSGQDTLSVLGGIVNLDWNTVYSVTNTLSYRMDNTDISLNLSTNGSISIYITNTTNFTLHLSGPAGTRDINVLVIVPVNLPTEYDLGQNYPNPFDTETTISFALPKDQYVSLKVFDLIGREVATVLDGMQTIGIHRIKWIPQNIANGVYRYRLTAGSFIKTRRMVLDR
jgi:hypothetical protein